MTKDQDTQLKARGSARRRISPALVLSVVALFAALSGAAVALPGMNTVQSNDVINEALKSADLKDGEVGSSDIGSSAVRSTELASMHTHENSVIVPGGVNENATYNAESVDASCGAGEQLVSGSGHWTGDGADEELFLSEIMLNHGSGTVTVRGGNDIGPGRTLVAVAHCLTP